MPSGQVPKSTEGMSFLFRIECAPWRKQIGSVLYGVKGGMAVRMRGWRVDASRRLEWPWWRKTRMDVTWKRCDHLGLSWVPRFGCLGLSEYMPRGNLGGTPRSLSADSRPPEAAVNLATVGKRPPIRCKIPSIPIQMHRWARDSTLTFQLQLRMWAPQPATLQSGWGLPSLSLLGTFPHCPMNPATFELGMTCVARRRGWTAWHVDSRQPPVDAAFLTTQVLRSAGWSEVPSLTVFSPSSGSVPSQISLVSTRCLCLASAS